jgi:proton-dependent oligopeptide transporter, POT family
MTMGLAFLMFPPLGGGPNSTPLLALMGIVLVFTLAELLLSPVGLSVTTKLAPEAFHTQMVALFTSRCHWGRISGELARFHTAENEGTYFGALGGTAIGIGARLAVALVLKLMRGVR